MTTPYRIERLAKQDRKAFDCGVEPLTNYLRKQAGQDQKRRVAVCYLLIEQATEQIAAFYTLSAGSIELVDLPLEHVKKLPRYPTLPIARVGRLAVSLAFRGRGLGSTLLADAIKRSRTAEIGVYAIVVDAKDDQAAAFYEHHGFKRIGESNALLLPLGDSLRKL